MELRVKFSHLYSGWPGCSFVSLSVIGLKKSGEVSL